METVSETHPLLPALIRVAEEIRTIAATLYEPMQKIVDTAYRYYVEQEGAPNGENHDGMMLWMKELRLKSEMEQEEKRVHMQAWMLHDIRKQLAEKETGHD